MALVIITTAYELLANRYPYYFRPGYIAPEIEEIRKIKNNMNIEMGEKIIVRAEREYSCPDEKAPGGCPIYIVPSEYFDINFVISFPSPTKPCLKDNYTIATTKKEGVAELILKYACSDEVYKKYTINTRDVKLIK